MNRTKIWIEAFRLRTLPLSVSGVIMGSFIAWKERFFSWRIFSLAIATTLFLQILSNLANDYGDSKNGKDNACRLGPVRAVQSGEISFTEMKRMILIFCLLSLISGVWLIVISQIPFFSTSFIVLILLGLMSIWAALSYTIGKNPYGYSGWGDLSVFLFFGLFSVLGTYFLYAKSLSAMVLMPAISVGAFSVGVLNINNMRDYVNDMATGKRTIVVKIGPQKAKAYHLFLLIVPIINALFYIALTHGQWYNFIFLIVALPIALHARRILKTKEHRLFDNELRKLALIALAFSVLFGISINL